MWSPLSQSLCSLPTFLHLARWEGGAPKASQCDVFVLHVFSGACRGPRGRKCDLPVSGGRMELVESGPGFLRAPRPRSSVVTPLWRKF